MINSVKHLLPAVKSERRQRKSHFLDGAQLALEATGNP